MIGNDPDGQAHTQTDKWTTPDFSSFLTLSFEWTRLGCKVLKGIICTEVPAFLITRAMDSDSESTNGMVMLPLTALLFGFPGTILDHVLEPSPKGRADDSGLAAVTRQWS